MAKYDFSDLGNQIRDRVQRAMESMDYEKLNEDISNTVGKALEEVKKSVNTFTGPKQKDVKDTIREEGKQEKKRTEAPPQEEFYPPRDVIGKPKGRVAGILYTVFGFIGVAGFGIPNLVGLAFLLSGTLTVGFMGAILGVLLPLLIVFSIMAARGIALNCRTSRFRQYVKRIGPRNLCKVKDLSRAVGKSEKYVRKDLNKMIGLGMFPEGHLDQEETCLMLDEETYELYLDSMRTLRDRREEEEIKEQQMDSEDEAAKELRNVIDTGREYIRQIRTANDALVEEEVSLKLQRLEEVISKIFAYVELNPEKLPEIKRFAEYYLPTTLKLVNAYQKFDAEPIQGDNIRKSKEEIRQTLDTINEAFENLLDSLYEDIAMDISTDISVLQTMLAQEGLTGDDFKKKDEGK